MSSEKELLIALVYGDQEKIDKIIKAGKPVDMLKLLAEAEKTNKELKDKMFDGLTDPIH